MFWVIVLFEFGVLWFWFLMVFVCLFFVGVGFLHCLVMVYVIARVCCCLGVLLLLFGGVVVVVVGCWCVLFCVCVCVVSGLLFGLD